MILTEEDAKKRWCPLTRVRVSDTTNCIASGCMAWRGDMPLAEWRDLVSFLSHKPEKWTLLLLQQATDKAKAEGFHLGRGVRHMEHFVIVGKFIAERGYCGLAGSPTETTAKVRIENKPATDGAET